MLLTIFYIINGVPINSTLIKSKRGNVFVLKITEHHCNELLLLYNRADTLSPFCFSINPAQPYSIEFLNLLESFFYLPFYYTENGKPVVFSEKDIYNDQMNDSIQSLLKENTFSLIDIKTPEEVNFHETTSIELAYQNTILNDANEVNSFFVELHNLEDIVNIDTALHTMDINIQNNNAQIYHWKMRVKTLQDKNVTAETRLSAAILEIENLYTYLDIIRSNSQAKELQEYYNKEYEILPKWYKKLGHLLKVLMGKRNFRSLFNDRVKKYKD